MANEFVHGTVGTELTQAEWEGVGTHVLNSQATGDIIYASSATQLSRLAVGSNTEVLTLSGGVPTWAAAGAAAAGSLTGSTLASGVTASSLTSVGTIATGTWEGTTVAVAQGGTGATSLNNLIALSTMTTGNYVATVTGGTGITSSGATSREGKAHSLSVDASQTQITAVGTIATGVWEGTDVGVAHGGTGASTLTANGVLIGNGTSAVASVDMSTKGHVLIGDGSGNPQMLAVGDDDQVLTADSGETTGVKWAAAAGGGATTLAGSQTTEATTTSTSATDLLSVTSISITALQPCFTIAIGRKTTGATEEALLGLKINTTVVGEAATSTNRVLRLANNNQVKAGLGGVFFGPRLTNYQKIASGFMTSYLATGQQDIGGVLSTVDTNAVPIATITSWIYRGLTNSGSQTLGADEAYVYKMALS